MSWNVRPWGSRKLHAPSYSPNRWAAEITNGGGQPATTTGTSITPGNNSFPAYVQILAATAHETFFCTVHVHSNEVAGQARNTLVNIGIDPAGGTAYVTRIPNLLCSGAATYLSLGAGIYYSFPLYIPSGSTIAAQASVNNATVGTLRVVITLYGRPSRAESVWCGHYVDSFGEATATSTGTAVTPGTASEGAYAQLGSNTTKPYWWWQVGAGTNDATITAFMSNIDLAYGDSTNRHLIIRDQRSFYNASEAQAREHRITDAVALVPSGVGIWGRMQVSTAQADHQMLAHGLGG